MDSENNQSMEHNGSSDGLSTSTPKAAPTVPDGERTVEFKLEESSDFSRENTNFASNNRERRRSVASSSGGRSHSSMRSSMELRRQPVDVLLRPRGNTGGDTEASSKSETELEDEDESRDIDIMHRTCLRPGYTLSKQLMLSFGIINAFTIIFVLIICIFVAISAGESVKSINADAIETLANDRQGTTARYLAESLDQRLMLFDTVKMMEEATQDRFEGYPEASDDFVPFLDVYSQTRKYPIVGEPMPLDWQLEVNVNDGNYQEFLHTESRWDFYKKRQTNTVKAGFLMQGSCDPSALDPSSDGYYPNCTDANNNITTGGVIAPSPTNDHIYRKSSDLVPLLRALFESRGEIRDLGLFFINSGAGASVNYPQYTVSYNGSYNSTGCEWMKEPNPYDGSRPIGSQDMIDKCHPQGEIVSTRAYNPMEREWCAYMALNPDQNLAFVGYDSWNSNQYLLLLGKGVYDRTTKEFIACTYVGIQISSIDKELQKYKVTPRSEVSIIVWEETGNIASSTKLNATERDGDIPIYDASLGLTKESYDSLFNLVDYESRWSPDEVRQSYTDFIASDGDGEYFVASYPMPPVPKEYDPAYKPIFLIVTSTPKEYMDVAVQDVNDVIDDGINRVNIVAIVIGCVGFVVSMIIIIMMARVITSPLGSMNATASEIVNQFGDPSAEQVISGSGGLSKEHCFAPKTELSEVVKAFNEMVVSFSGKAMAKSEKGKQEEVENIFNMRKPFLELYESRNNKDFAYHFETKSPQNSLAIDPLDELSYRNEGSNLLEETNITKRFSGLSSSRKTKTTSPLFIWITVLIVVPLLVGSILVAALVLSSYEGLFDEFVTKAEGYFLEIEKSALSVHSNLRADYVGGITSKSMSELHLITRYTSWLLFGGLNRSDSFTELLAEVENCKNDLSDIAECPFVQENDACGCDWNSTGLSFPCHRYLNETASRYLQKQFMIGQSTGNPQDGSRNVTLFPNASFSPETTHWFENQTVVPGFERGFFASGYKTTFDRVRQTSAIPIVEALFNYDKEKRTVLNAWTGFEADGMVIGYSGCDVSWATLSSWSSNEGNGAYKIRPELCPLGKYGYDPRCREWYSTGRNLYLQNRTSLHVTSPYLFANGGVTAQTSTTPLFDPKTGEHVGQSLVDFETRPILEALEEDTEFGEGGFPVLITTSGEIGDTVIAPGFSWTLEEAVPIAEKVLPYDSGCSDTDCVNNVNKFNDIVSAMKIGELGEVGGAHVEFSRKTENEGEETIIIAYAPVNVKMFQLEDSSNFSRGVTVSDFLVYSLALAQPKASILKPFKAIEDRMYRSIKLAIISLSVVIAVAAFLVVYFSHRLASSITKPMVYLLDLIRSINRDGIGQDVLSSKTIQASYEIVGFCYTMEMLYKLVRSANAAFHAGELEVAYKVLVDALRLFKRLGNKKAIAVASNNLGNTVLSMYRELQASHHEKLGGLTKEQMVTTGIGLFHTSIQMGEKAYDEFHVQQGWTPVCLDFTQHLANRYFNRGLFLLMAKEDHEKPEELEALGKRDLRITRDMDHEVVAYGEDIGWGAADRVASMFNVNLVRLRGYNQLLEMGYDDDFDIEDLIEDSFEMVKTESQKESSNLFHRIGLPGRMQQIETELMKYKLRSGDLETASRVAIRMLFDDELVFVDALSQAIEVLLLYLDVAEFEKSDRLRIKETLEDYHEYLKIEAVKQKQSEIFALESSIAVAKSTEFTSSTNSERHLNTEQLSVWTLKDCSGQFVVMEDF